MTSSDTIFKEAWTTLHQANHTAEAYRYRATQLTKWKRLRDFLNLGVAPTLLLATFVWENTVVRNVLLAASGICSISSWSWVIFGFSYNWDNQLRLSIDVPLKLKLIISEIKEEIEIFVTARNNQDNKAEEQSANKLKKLMQQVHNLNEDIEREQVYAKPWMNLMAQQHTMRYQYGKCGSCYQEWIPGSEVFNSDNAKEFLKKAKQKKLKGRCESCGQKLPNESQIT